MKSKQTPRPSISSEQIAVKAHELWQKAGSPAGRDREFWLAAEQTLQREHGNSKQTPLGKVDLPPTAPFGTEPISETLEPEIPTTGGHSGRSPTSL